MELKLNSVIIIAVLLSANVFADNIPNTFEAGEAIKASEMNENFVDLQNQIDVLKAQVEASDNSDSKNEFVGFTLARTNGDAGGLYGLNKMCSDEYTGAKVCKSGSVSEINPALILEAAWVQPEIQDTGFEGNSMGRVLYYGRTGYQTISDSKDCYNWNEGSIDQYNFRGFVLTNHALVVDGTCTEQRPVACCK